MNVVSVGSQHVLWASTQTGILIPPTPLMVYLGQAEAYAQSLQNAHDIKKATYQDIIWPMLQEQREKGITASPGEMGST